MFQTCARVLKISRFSCKLWEVPKSKTGYANLCANAFWYRMTQNVQTWLFFNLRSFCAKPFAAGFLSSTAKCSTFWRISTNRVADVCDSINAINSSSLALVSEVIAFVSASISFQAWKPWVQVACNSSKESKARSCSGSGSEPPLNDFLPLRPAWRMGNKSHKNSANPRSVSCFNLCPIRTLFTFASATSSSKDLTIAGPTAGSIGVIDTDRLGKTRMRCMPWSLSSIDLNFPIASSDAWRSSTSPACLKPSWQAFRSSTLYCFRECWPQPKMKV